MSTIQCKQKKTDTILPPSQAIWVSIDLRVITITRAEAAAMEAYKEAAMEAYKEAAMEALKMVTEYMELLMLFL